MLSSSRTLFELGLIAVLAAASPIIAKPIRLPSILVLLALGFGAGAIGALNPNALLGENLISAIVSVAVGIILFNAGLDLDFRRFVSGNRRVVRMLLSVGILTTWAVAGIGAYFLFGLSWEVALILGAVLVVSGPTVVGPLLRFIRPSANVDSVLMWEGTFADPLGATLGVVAFNAVIAGHATAGSEVAKFLLATAIGAGFGVLGGALVLAWLQWFDPEPSQVVPGTLMFVVAGVVCADLLHADTGLITGLVIGAMLANRPPRGVGEPRGLLIQRAKLMKDWRAGFATLTTFLIGMLFIILSARVSPHQIVAIGWVSIAFIALLVLLGRPLAVFLSTLGSELRTRERAFVAWMAPRGIVAAATSSTFALGLSRAGVGGGSQKLIPITFVVIAATALIYGLSGGPVSRALGVSSVGPGGVLLIGASRVARSIARALKREGIYVCLWTTIEADADACETEGLLVYRGDLLDDASGALPSDLDELYYALAVSDDDALNAMISADLAGFFGPDRVFQLSAAGRDTSDFFTRTPVLFDAAATHSALLASLEAGAEVVGSTASADPTGDRAVSLPMFISTPGESLSVLVAGASATPKPGQHLIGLSGALRRQ